MNSLGSSREIVQNKLIIMYILNKLNIPISNNNITSLVLETRLMNYFMFQQCFNELQKGKLLEFNAAEKKSTESMDGYHLTAAGNNTLQYFLSLIPPGIKKQLDIMLPDARKEIQGDALVTADFMPESESKFTVNCKMGEKGFPLMELTAAVGTKKDAREVCENWKTHSSEIYSEIIEALTKKRDIP